MRNNNPMRRLGTVWDIAEGVVYLAGPTGRFITGELLAIDGGAQIWGPSWSAWRPELCRDVEWGIDYIQPVKVIAELKQVEN